MRKSFPILVALSSLFALGCGDGADSEAGGGGSADRGGAGEGGEGAGGEAEGGHGADWWRPNSDAPIPWHWQLTGEFDASDIPSLSSRRVFDLDGELTSAETVAALHALGDDVVVICYFDAGVYETYRSDAQMFVDAGLDGGPSDLGWEDSYWVDVRDLDALMPILEHRMKDWCLAKGFDAIEPDETEVWANWNEQRPEDPITLEQNNAFQEAVSAMGHGLGLSVGLKGNNTEAPALEPLFDWALTEQCWEFEECEFFRDSFVAQGKAVFSVEYDVPPDCALANEYHINASQRDLDLVGPNDAGYLYEPCLPDSATSWP